LLKFIDGANLGLATAIDGWLSAKKASKMNQSVGTEKTGATLPTLRAELVKLPAGRELQISGVGHLAVQIGLFRYPRLGPARNLRWREPINRA
jgi:hypothetical protein